ncbi:MAG: helix-turn-helix domain-containing protein [Candidatus Thermoplasmatota archaeon]
MSFPVEQLQKARLTCADVVQCAFDLSDQDVRTYEALNNLGGARTEDLARALDRDASVVYRSLQRLVQCNVASKTKGSMAEGGYYYVYSAAPKRVVKTRLRACVNDWHQQMLRAIDRL